MRLKIIKNKSEKLLVQRYFLHKLNQILFSDWGGNMGDKKKNNLDMEYWLEYRLEYFHLHIDLNLLRDKVFCRRPFLLHLWPKRNQEKTRNHSVPQKSWRLFSKQTVWRSSIWVTGRIFRLNPNIESKHQTFLSDISQSRRSHFSTGYSLSLKLIWIRNGTKPWKSFEHPGFNQMQSAWRQNLPCSVWLGDWY